MVVIRTAMNSFDWTAHHMLSVYSTHPLIDSDYYLYLLDTSVVEKDFWFKTYELLPKRGTTGKVFNYHHYCSDF